MCLMAKNKILMADYTLFGFFFSWFIRIDKHFIREKEQKKTTFYNCGLVFVLLFSILWLKANQCNVNRDDGRT